MNDVPRNRATPKMSQANAENAAVGRRGPRVRLETAVLIYYSWGEDSQAFYDEAKTIEVSAYGGLIETTRAVEMGQSVLLIDPTGGQSMVCQIRSVVEPQPNVYHVGLEFTTPSPKFWGIAFSADDWDPAEQKLPPTPEPAKAASPAASAGQLQPQSDRVAATAAPQSQGKSSQPASRGWGILIWAGAGLAIVLAFVIFWTGRSSTTPSAAPDAGSSVVEGMAPEDARIIPNLGNFRLAAERDFDPLAVSWLRGLGQQPSGDIVGQYSGSGQSHAYVLIGNDHQRRVVIVAGGQVRCDAEYRTVAIAALVPKEFLPRISWDDTSPIESEGDGLLVVRSASDPGSGVVLLLSGDQVVPRVPVDFHQIPTQTP
jgi:hypothetical protein